MPVFKTIGVGTTSSLKHLKKHLLLVDEIAVVLGVDSTGDWDIREKDPRLAADLDWLRDRGLVWSANSGGADAINVAVRSSDLAEVSFEKGRVVISAPSSPTTSRVCSEGLPSTRIMRVSELLHALSDICCRVECQWLERNRPVHAFTLLPPSSKVARLEGLTSVSSDVLSVVLKTIPSPRDDVSLEDILEFRADSGARSSLLSLRKWIGTLSTGNASPGECAQELEWLLHQYEEYMQLHKLKIEKGALETVITAGAQTAEDIVKIKWGSLAKSLFSVSNRKIECIRQRNPTLTAARYYC